MSPAIKYTLGRVGLFVAVAVALLPFRLNPFLTLMIALLVSMPLSYLLLRRWRDRMAERLEDSMSARRVQREKLRAALSGDDDEDTPPDDPAGGSSRRKRR